MYELKQIGKVFTSKSVGTGPSSYEKRIYQAAVSQRLRKTGLGDLTMSSLAHTASLLDCQRPTFVVSTSIISLFFVLDGRFVSVSLLPFALCYIINTNRDQSNTLYCPLSAALSVAIPSSLS